MFKRPSVHYGRTPEPVTPYQKAAQIWDERIGSARVQARAVPVARGTRAECSPRPGLVAAHRLGAPAGPLALVT